MMDIRKEAEQQEAREMNRDRFTGTAGAHPVGTGVGAAGGAAAGAAIGWVAGPVGAMVGGALGTVVGGMVGSDVGELVNPSVEESFWRGAYLSEPLYDADFTYDDYAPAYRAGYAKRLSHTNQSWEQVEGELQSAWPRDRRTSRLDWATARHATRAGWHRADHSSRPQDG